MQAAGNKTRIAIVQTTQEASALLAWRKSSQPSADSPLRIWTADSLRHKDISAIQSQAVAAFAEGAALPRSHLSCIHT